MFLILQVPAGKGLIRAICSRNSFNQDFGALPALFGPPLPAEGLTGLLAEARPENACQPIKGPPNASSSAFIVLIRRYNCSFATKVLHAQQAGYQAALVHNVNSQTLVSMVGEADAKQKIRIPSMFTADAASDTLKRLHRSGKLTSMILVPEHFHFSSSGASEAAPTAASACKCRIHLQAPCSQIVTLHILWMACIPVSAVVASLLIEKYLSECKKWKMVRNQPSQRKGKEPVSFSFLSSKYQECAICLEKYQEYDSLKVLSCSHAFHSQCIDLWHITQARRKTCPLCMQRVTVVTRLQTVRLWKEESRGSGKNRKFGPGRAQPSLDQRYCWLTTQQF
ncbi:E3 ubiquitin-protein ligase RNF167-like [Eublepharis macularius]|uniref:RING-type E3 ubiquitin transferase n=1 Tax=Eublepharis macularius TaxID=481883 RepID=A0AA97KYB9_EUBMA|nr:E3 ubiquitin-protein ligase RNF167-like [Eublepharis macularius]